MRTRRALLALTALAAALAVGIGGAFGYWSTTGTGSGSATTGTLNPATGVQASGSAGTGSVAISWTGSAVAANAPAPTGYYVVRHDSSNQAAAACKSDATHLITGSTGCTDTLVPVGTYTYTVVAVLSSWTATSAASPAATVAKADQAITFTSTPPANATYQGATYMVTATGGASGNPVTFAVDQAAGSVCAINGAVVSFIGVGTCTIDANQAGGTYYNPAPQAQQSFSVGKAAQTITFTSSAPTNAVVGGASYAPTATGGASMNPVVFTIDATTAGTCSIGNGVVTFQHSGSCTVDANQAGSANYAAANQVQQSFAVGPGAQAITFTSSPTNPTVNGPTYTVAANGGASGNPVTFSIDPAASSVCSISGTTVSFTAGGTCIIDANQAGDSDYLAAAQLQQRFTVAKAGQTITFSSTVPSNATVGGTYAATASATSGLPVTFSSGSPSVCTSGGTNGATFTFSATGTCIVNADQAGNASYSAAPTENQSFAVSAGVTGLVWTAVTANGTAVSPTCSGVGTTSSSCTAPVPNSGSFSAKIMFVNANGQATVFSATSDATISIKETGKSTSSGTLTILKGTTTSSGAYTSQQKNGSNVQVLTATFTNGTVTYTAQISG